VADVVVRLDDDVLRAILEVVEQEKAHERSDAIYVTASNQLRAALDSPPVEERVEFCVIGGDPRSGYNEGGWGPISLPSARQAAKRWAEKGWRNVRIQSRTITTFSDGTSLTSPWTDLPSEEGER
jgi:hypothetical protein